MPGSGPKRAAFRFGVFELDPISGELRKQGLRLRLPDQSFQILAALLERPGEIVNRDEIQKRLWPAGTYVDYDNAINGAVRKLRVVLGDTAECARFVETLARRGYRFIAPVTTNDGRISAKDSEPGRNAGVSIHLTGRERERAALLLLVDEALQGHGSMVLIGGEPGIGKTHLTRAVLSDAVKRGCFAMIGHSYEMEGSPPYVPFIEMLEYWACVAPRDAFREALGDCGSEIARLMPELRRMYSDIPASVGLPPEQQRRFLFNAYREFVGRAARSMPIVAAFEDIHWADESTLLLLQHLGQPISQTPMLIIGTYRDTEADGRNLFARALAEWIRENTATRISLMRLDSQGVGAMLTALSGKAPPSFLIRTVFEQTDGNPFFVEEVFRYLAEQGRLLDEQGVWCSEWQPSELEVPRGVRLVISHRLERLRKETQCLLTKAAVIGRSFNLRQLEDLEGVPCDALLERLEEAERAHLISAERSGREIGYRFVHELVRQTLSETLTLPRRQQLHAQIADAIERIYSTNLESHASALAHHLYQAGAQADLDKTVSYLTLAARLASTAAAYEEVLTHVDNAFSILGPEPHPGIAELHAMRAIALRSLGRLTEAIESYVCAIDELITRRDIQRAMEASFHLASIYGWNNDCDRSLAVINRVLQFADKPTFLVYRLLLVKALTFCMAGKVKVALDTLSQAKEDFETRGPEAISDGFASMCEARIHFMAAQIGKAGECGREALRRFRVAGDLWGEADTFEAVASALWMGHPLDVEAMAADSIARANKIGHQNAAWTYRKFSAQSLMARGDLEKSERLMREIHEGSVGKSAWRFVDHIVLGAICHYLGNLDEAVLCVRRGMEIEPPSYLSGHLSGMLFWTLAAKADGKAEAALSAARLHLPEPERPLSSGACGCLALIIEGLAILERFADAAALKSSAERVVADGPLCLYTQHLFRTSAGIAAASARDWVRAEEHHQIAIHQADSSPYRISQPGARYWYAEMLLSRGVQDDQERARVLLCEALSLHKSMGMKWHIQRVAARIAQL